MKLILMMHKTRKFIVINLGLFVLFMFIYTTLDLSANDGYQYLIDNFGYSVFMMHLIMNVILAATSSVVLTWSFIAMQVNKKDSKWTNMPIIGVFVGFLTFGCTPCVVAFLSIFGIGFAPMILPNGNILWKVLVLGLIILSGWMTILYNNKGCKVENN